MVVVLAFVSLHFTQAQNYERMSEVESDQYGDFAHVTADYQTTKTIRSYWAQEVLRLKTVRQYEFALTGNNECVLRVTIPSRYLFTANDSTLLPNADASLRPLLRWIKNPNDLANVIVAAHTDNNGSERYLQNLSGGRARAIHRWLANQGVGPANIRSFGFANKVSRNNNENIGQRERNRRVTIYFIPNKKMVKSAGKNKLIMNQ